MERPIGIGLATLAAVVAVFALLRVARTNTELRDEVAMLRLEVREFAQRAATSASFPMMESAAVAAHTGSALSDDNSELARLREEIRGLKNSTQALTQLAQEAQVRKAEGNLPVTLIPFSAWKNAGKATPAAGVETALWAAVGGEIDTLADSIGFTASARQKADAFYAGLSEATR